ncbi:DUF6069 family protein [Streptomyces sp. NPDC087859]|uniref:DUF6069 family protein n=1 Tax=Streptomyces sp. NPDC087859 TaxID=3365812 RepID=UPI0037F1C8E3
MSTPPSSATAAPAQSIRPEPSRAAAAGWLIAGTVAAIIFDALIALVSRAAGASDDFEPLQPGPYVTFTVLGILVGAAGWAVIRRRSAQPRTLVYWLVPAVVVISLVPDLLMFVSDYIPHADAAGIIGLVLMHVAVAAVAVAAYHRALPLNDKPRSRLTAAPPSRTGNLLTGPPSREPSGHPRTKQPSALS